MEIRHSCGHAAFAGALIFALLAPRGAQAQPHEPPWATRGSPLVRELLDAPTPADATELQWVSLALGKMEIDAESAGLRSYIHGAQVLRALGRPVPAAPTVRDAAALGNGELRDVRAHERSLAAAVRVALAPDTPRAAARFGAEQRGEQRGAVTGLSAAVSNSALAALKVDKMPVSLTGPGFRVFFDCSPGSPLAAGETRTVLCAPGGHDGAAKDFPELIAGIGTGSTSVRIGPAKVRLPDDLPAADAQRRADTLVDNSTCEQRGTCLFAWLHGMQAHWVKFAIMTGVLAGAVVFVALRLVRRWIPGRPWRHALAVVLSASVAVPVYFAFELCMGSHLRHLENIKAVMAALAGALLAWMVIRLPPRISFPLVFAIGLVPGALGVARVGSGMAMLLVPFLAGPMALGLLVAMALVRLGAADPESRA